MTFEDCIILKNRVSSIIKIAGGFRWKLLVTPQTDEYFRKYTIILKDREDNEAINYACDNRFILRWISLDKGFVSYLPFIADKK